MFAPFDIVVIRDDYEDAEVRGQRGHIIGEVTADQIGVFVYDAQRVWCLHPDDVVATGEIDVAERDAPRAAPIRVSAKGDVLS